MVIIRTVTAIMGTVVGLTFFCGFGNVLGLVLRLGVPVWVAPLIAPAVDLTFVALLVAVRRLSVCGSPSVSMRSARRLLVGASAVTLALNVAEPLVAGEVGKALFDAVGPLLLIGWSEVGPGLLQAIGHTNRLGVSHELAGSEATERASSVDLTQETQAQRDEGVPQQGAGQAVAARVPEALLAQARQEDAAHRMALQKPISADTLRARLGVGAVRARQLVKIVRSEFDEQAAGHRPACERHPHIAI
ncbi:hypothetical protein ABZU76_33965 [Amycolatopsis sp. NPDC005232]|uniref:hypothetical protein n=1 Tax=Amycolatopsis sp. NPDC005232 TaxID=3157027 RepID=UPI0033AEEDC2